MSGLFVCIIGPDGSGKTTIARNTAAVLESQGHSTNYVWLRFESLLLKLIVKVARKMREYPDNQLHSYKMSSADKKEIFDSSLPKLALILLVILTYLVKTKRGITEPLRREAIIISDRYFHDTVVDLWIDFGMGPSTMPPLMNLFGRLLPQPDLTFMLDVPEQVSMSRKNDIPSIDYISQRRNGFRKLRGIMNVDCMDIDGTLPVDQNTQRIVSRILQRMGET